jgi:hypothetical protein
MPNWTGCRLLVSGPKEALDEFVEQSRGLGEDREELALDFDRQIPTPDDAVVREEGFNDVTEWRTAYWGTKSTALSSKLAQAGETGVAYRFYTAWSAPKPWAREVAALHPELEFLLTYKDEDISHPIKTLWVSAKGAREDQIFFEEGYIVYTPEGVEPDWGAAERAAEEADPDRALKLYDPHELAWSQLFDSLIYVDGELGEEELSDFRHELKGLPKDLTRVRKALGLKKVRSVSVVHDEHNPCSASLIGTQTGKAYRGELDAAREKLDFQRHVFLELSSEGGDERLLEGIKGLGTENPKEELELLKYHHGSSDALRLHAEDLVEATQPKIGEALARLELSGVLRAAGLYSEQGGHI